MQVIDLAFVVLGFLDLIREVACHALDRLPFPRTHLRLVELARGCNLLNRLVTAQRLKRVECH
jgi:hypothetical protein